MKIPTLSEHGIGRINVERLIETRMLVQANSGSGKSWALRRIAEQTYGHCQQIIIDPDGEFHTLREQFDYVLAGKKGDCPADIKSAALLARRLLELNVSAIVDIYELGASRRLFVQRFLDALMNVPRELWHPVLIFLDEAHVFVPEQGHAESSSAVIDLMSRGRKRGFCGLLATQRISKLHKDAAAECNNKLIGRSALDIDMKRAAAELGFTSKEEILSLRKLEDGHFYAFGPALSNTVEEVTIGPVTTTHLRAGQRAAPATPPRDRVKKILAQLADLPQEAEEEAKSVGELRLKIKQLEGDLRKAQAATPIVKGETKTVTVEKLVVKNAQIKRVEAFAIKVERLGTQLGEAHDLFKRDAAELKAALSKATQPTTAPPRTATHLAKPTAKAPTREPAKRTSSGGEAVKLPVGEAAVLRAAIQFTETGVIKKRLSVLTAYKRSTRDAYIARLREKGFITEEGDTIFATEDGVNAMPDAEPLPTGEALRDFWYRELPAGEKVVLQFLVDKYPAKVAKTDIDDATEFKRSTRDAYISRLIARQLVEDVGRGEVIASENLFG